MSFIYAVYTAVIFIWFFLVTAVLGILATISGIFDNSGKIGHKLDRAWAKSILFVSRVKVTIKGLSNISKDKGYIYMPNHVSNYDIFVLSAHLPIEFRWLAKAELFKIPILGQGMRGAGYIPIARKDRTSAIESLNKAGKVIEKGVSMLIFPEGTRSFDGKIKDFKKGGFILAIDTKTPIVPVVIRGSFSIMPKKKFLVKPGNASIEILPPVDTSCYTRENKEELIYKVRKDLKDALEKESLELC